MSPSPTRCHARFAALLALLVAGCGGGGSGERPGAVLAAVGEADGGLSPVEELVEADILRARKEIVGAVLSGDERVAAWAAVYAARIGIEDDQERARAALVAGTAASDPLLAALCWRRLAAHPAEGTLPEAPQAPGTAPVAEALAALAHAGAGGIPAAQAPALGLPTGEPGRSSRPEAVPDGRREALLGLADPFDDGPLALAVLFVEARRERWVERSGGEPRWAAAKIRRDLVDALFGERAPEVMARVEACPPPEDPRYPEITEQLASPLMGRPAAVLRGAALGAGGSLRIGALRALAVAVRKPEAGDVGAAAASLACDDPLVRLEAARTYLFLAARATRR
jgi:hypothetical protein